MMIEKRLVQCYAADAGVDLDIAERGITLTYILRILADHGLLERLAFKGGIAIRKIFRAAQAPVTGWIQLFIPFLWQFSIPKIAPA